MPENISQTPQTEAVPSPKPGVRIYLLAAAVVVCVALVTSAAFFLRLESLDAAQEAAAAQAIPDTSVFDDITLTASSALVLDTQSGAVLFAKDATAPRALASLTKLMLAVVVSETLAPGDTVVISERALLPEGESILAIGEPWPMQDLLDYTLVVSSNDGAYALAEAAGKRIRERYPGAPEGDAEATIWRMNQKAQELRLAQTYFLDSHGLDESASMAGAYGSAQDIATLFAYAAQTQSESLASTASASITLTTPSGLSVVAHNTNSAIGNLPGLIIGKTGFTDLAGGNLGVVFDAGLSRPVVVVVLGSTQESRFTDVETLAAAARDAIAASR